MDDGRFTGRTYGTMTYQQGKVIRLEAWLAQHPQRHFGQLYAYSDSLNDRPMLEYADHAAVINPDAELQTLAQQNGWEICRWTR